MVKVVAPIKCGKCGEVTIFEIVPPTNGGKSFQFLCPNGHEVSDSKGGYEVVDLSNYDEKKLKRVVL
jgi:hypothetical protein